jgi:hypothetical protein
MGTVLAGLVLLVIWLMEYDRDYQTVAATRLPVPVISAHALLGVGGLLVWGFYLLTDEDPLAWGSVAGLGVIVVLGLVMAARWVHVYRAYAAPPRRQVCSWPFRRNGTSRARSSSSTASSPPPLSSWSCSPCFSVEADPRQDLRCRFRIVRDLPR